MFGGSKDNQATITRKTKIKQKHKIHDPNLLGNQPILGPQMVMPGTTNVGQRRSSSSSSSSSSDRDRQNVGQQKPGMVEGLTGGTQMGQGSMGPGLSNQGYSQGMQNYPNTGLTGTGLSSTGMTGGMGMGGTGMGGPYNQQGELPPAKTMAKNEAKVTLIQKVKEKFMHHGQK